jgi:UDP-glucose 4-epimerase
MPAMTVAVTGAFGNVGTSTVQALRRRGHRIIAVDLPTTRNRLAARRRTVEVVWADVTDESAIRAALRPADAVVHLAALIPPHSDRSPELARMINVEGTRTVVAAAGGKRFVHASSLSVYGRTQHLLPPRRVTDPVAPFDLYGATKAEAEDLVRRSGADWVILRFAAVLPLRLPLVIDPLIFDVPLTDRIEFVHTRDVGTAVARACEVPEASHCTLNVGGGAACQLLQRDVINRALELLGIGRLPEHAFSGEPFHCDWLDSDESQRLLEYQSRTFDDYLTELRRHYGWRTPLVKAVAPLIRAAMLRRSPYLKVAAR